MNTVAKVSKKTAEKAKNSSKTKKNIGGLLIGFVSALIVGIVFYWLFTFLKTILAIILGVLIGLLIIIVTFLCIAYYFKEEIVQYLIGEVDVTNFKEDLRLVTTVIFEDFVDTHLVFLTQKNKKKVKEIGPKLLFTLLWSFLRSKTLLIIIGLFIAIFGTISNYLLYEQNILIKEQNEEGVKQTILQEANSEKEKKDLIVGLFQKVNEELEGNNQRTLSDDLIVDIINLSAFLKPYKKFDRESETLEGILSSPERGFLLSFLLSKKLKYSTYDSIYARAEFAYADLRALSLEKAYLKGVNLRYANLNHANLKKGNLKKADLNGAALKQVNLQEANLDFVSIEDGIIHKTNFEYSSLRGANLNNVQMDSSFFKGANLLASVLNNAAVNFTNFYKANFYSADFTNSTITYSNLDSTIIRNADMDSASILFSSLQDSNLTDIDMSNATMRSCTLNNSVFEKASFLFATIENCEMVETNLVSVDFEQANLNAVVFERADFTDAHNITYEQFSTVRLLKDCINFPPDVKNLIRISHPSIIE